MSTSDPASLPLSHGISLIDTGYLRPGLAASYLIARSGRAAFVETGTRHSTPRLLAALAEQQIDPGDVDYVIVTHVHLDHAGGAGSLMAELPNARLVVHPRGAKHLVDPSKLIAGATAVYGEQTFRDNYGELVPVAADRVIEAGDGFPLELGDSVLAFLDTPGHARHHFCVSDPASGGVFSGDTFGLAYRELDTERGPLLFPSTSPTQFEPERAKESIERLLVEGPEQIYLTHFGLISDPVERARDLFSALDASVEIANRHRDAGDRHDRILHDLTERFVERAARHGCSQGREEITALWGMDLELNAQGLEVWLDRQAG